MKNKNFILTTCIGLASMLSYAPMMAQSLPSTNVQMIVTPHNQTIDYRDRTLCFDIPANVEYETASDASWLTVRQGSDGTIYIHADMNDSYANRVANVTFTSTKDANLKKTLTITQGSCNAAELLSDKSRVYPSSATDNSHQSGEDIAKTYDDNTSTLFHTQYSPSVFKVSETNPAILTYNFEDVNSISSITYVPRADGSNGNFGKVKVSYKLQGDADYKELGEYNFAFKNTSSTIHLENNPLINPASIRFEVQSGSGDYASCAEMEFRDNSQSLEAQFNMFADDICSELKPDVDQAAIDTITNPFIKMLAQNIYDKKYDENYRVAQYPCHLSPTTQSENWGAPGKLYDQIAGVTGINFKSHSTQAVAVSGIPDDMDVQLKVVAWYVGRVGTNFDGGDPHTTTYTLRNGINVLKYDYDYDGLAYISYYSTDDPTNHPDIKVHFLNGQINGYLSPDKTNEDMYRLCASAPNKCMDLVGAKVHSIWTAEGLKNYCKASDNKSLGYIQYINLLDSLVGWEHRLLGLEKYNRLPDNRTMAYVNFTYYMFQGSFGVSFHQNQEYRVLNCNTLMYNDDDAIWGLSHEWGHQHQMTPYFCWSGQGECTNNMNSCYNVLHMGYKTNHAKRISEQWTNAYNRFIAHSDVSDIGKEAATRKRAYDNIGRFSWSTEIQDSIRSQYNRYKDENGVYLMPDVRVNPEFGESVNEVYVEEQTAPFFMLYCYFSNPENEGGKTVDFQQDMYESLRQIAYENGSTVEPDYENGVATKKTTVDKYELLAMAQNGNVNNAYQTFRAKYPNSVWVTHNYISSGMTYTQNSVPFIFNYIRKASKLCGYNLFDYFDKFGFLRTIVMTIDDYGNKDYAMTKLMKDEFKQDMEALGLKPMTDEMIEKISHATIPEYDTPNIPNTPTPKQ